MGQELRCPKCDSSEITANKKGFSGRKAVGGAILTGPLGLLAGTIGSNKIMLTCLMCGHRFRPGEQRRAEGRGDTQLGCAVVVVVLLVAGVVSDKLGCNKEAVRGKTESTLNQHSSAFDQLNYDTVKIKEEIVRLLKSIHAANAAPRIAMKQFSRYAAGLGDFSTNILQVHQAAKIAKEKMGIAELEISNIVLSQDLPAPVRDSLSTGLSTISSSYLTLSGAFDEAIEMTKNPSDNSYVEAFRDDMNKATQMYEEALANILKIKSRFEAIKTKKT